MGDYRGVAGEQGEDLSQTSTPHWNDDLRMNMGTVLLELCGRDAAVMADFVVHYYMRAMVLRVTTNNPILVSFNLVAFGSKYLLDFATSLDFLPGRTPGSVSSQIQKTYQKNPLLS